MAQIEVTLLNSMAGRDLAASLDRQAAWGIRSLDLKDAILGKGLLDLSEAEAQEAAQMIGERGLSVYCLSTGLFFEEVEAGPELFRTRHLERMPHLLRLAAILKPRWIRLLAARSSKRAAFDDGVDYLHAGHPWLLPLYREAIDRLTGGGWNLTLENEVAGCLLTTPGEVVRFFEALDRRDQVRFTWDVQNLWQMGTFPTLEVYRQLKPLIGYYHVKGGQTDGDGTALKWASALEDASWPAAEITRQVIRDRVSPVICLNPSHGARKPGYDEGSVLERDLAFLRRLTAEAEGA